MSSPPMPTTPPRSVEDRHHTVETSGLGARISSGARCSRTDQITAEPTPTVCGFPKRQPLRGQATLVHASKLYRPFPSQFRGSSTPSSTDSSKLAFGVPRRGSPTWKMKILHKARRSMSHVRSRVRRSQSFKRRGWNGSFARISSFGRTGWESGRNIARRGLEVFRSHWYVVFVATSSCHRTDGSTVLRITI